MRFYFHISNGALMAEDEYGMELPTLAAALEEGTRIIHDLLTDLETMDMRGGVIQIVGTDGRSFLTLPILPPPTNKRLLH